MKHWRDLLYFSKGERRALSVLLALIAVSGVLLNVDNGAKEAASLPAAQAQYIVQPANAPKPMQVSKKEVATFPAKQSGKVFPKAEKFPAGTVVELNTADTATLKKVPGIGTVFARRIVGYRRLLGGFYSVEQLREVYGMDEERYQSLRKWFAADTAFIAKLPVNELPADSLARHPYMSYPQARAIYSLRKRKGRLSGWENLLLLEEFTQSDREKLNKYVAF
ncbi:MAG: helix-hairpin-helix domain-containing protein [Bacteroidales bacterium]